MELKKKDSSQSDPGLPGQIWPAMATSCYAIRVCVCVFMCAWVWVWVGVGAAAGRLGEGWSWSLIYHFCIKRHANFHRERERESNYSCYPVPHPLHGFVKCLEF